MEKLTGRDGLEEKQEAAPSPGARSGRWFELDLGKWLPKPPIGRPPCRFRLKERRAAVDFPSLIG